jgi:2-polyprenyl-3-methyl-5-hydroxy-6-metoxy-1,4-benzoquinol methylase
MRVSAKKWFAQRSMCLEFMDTEPYSFQEFRNYLHELERINAWTLASRPTLHWLKQTLADMKLRRPVSILDVGSGNGDMLRQIWRWTQKQGVEVELTGVDLNPWSQKSAEQALPVNAQIHFETANVFDLDPLRRFDVIISSLFTHHLTDADNVRFLRWMEEHAKHSWFINDLHRHPLPYFFVKGAAHLLRLNLSVQNDGPLSVARAFTATDWRRLLDEAGISAAQTEIRWFFPFRYCVTRYPGFGNVVKRYR